MHPDRELAAERDLGARSTQTSALGLGFLRGGLHLLLVGADLLQRPGIHHVGHRRAQCQLGVLGVWIAMCCDEWLRGMLVYRRWKQRSWVAHALQSRQALSQ